MRWMPKVGVKTRPLPSELSPREWSPPVSAELMARQKEALDRMGGKVAEGLNRVLRKSKKQTEGERKC